MELVRICLATFATSFLSGFVPLVNVEAYLVGAAALLPACPPLVVILPTTLGQMSAKALLYLAGRGVLGLRLHERERVLALARRLEGRRGSSLALVFASALWGVPPFYVVSVAAGVMRLRAADFLLAGLAGRLLRFAAVFALPRLMGGLR